MEETTTATFGHRTMAMKDASIQVIQQLAINGGELCRHAFNFCRRDLAASIKEA